jgi:hypothetical protein
MNTDNRQFMNGQVRLTWEEFKEQRKGELIEVQTAEGIWLVQL